MHLLLDLIKRNRSAVILIALGILLVFYILMQFFIGDPFSNQDPTFSVVAPTEELKIVRTIPENLSDLEVYDTYTTVTFEFNMDVIPDSFTYSVSPVLETTTQYNADYPNKITIKPSIVGWQDNIPYTIYVSNVIAKTGEKLPQPYIATYRNSPPPTEGLIFPY